MAEVLNEAKLGILVYLFIFYSADAIREASVDLEIVPCHGTSNPHAFLTSPMVYFFND